MSAAPAFQPHPDPTPTPAQPAAPPLAPGLDSLFQPLSDGPPQAYAGFWRYAGKSWPRDLRALALMAATGWSSRLALSEWLVARDAKVTSTKAGTMQRLWTRLEERGLIQQETQVIDARRRVSVSLVELTPFGRELLYEVGIPHPVVPEWQRLRLRHEGDEQPVHTAMVILAAHFLRQRGFRTLVCPQAVAPYFPDLVLLHVPSNRCIYLEVEAPSKGGRVQGARLQRKWLLQVEQQGYAALCALNPTQRGQKMKSAKQVAAHGLATDLQTLHNQPETVWAAVWSDPLDSTFAAGQNATQHPLRG